MTSPPFFPFSALSKQPIQTKYTQNGRAKRTQKRESEKSKRNISKQLKRQEL